MPCVCGDLQCYCRLLCYCDKSKCNCRQCYIVGGKICQICNKHLHHDLLNSLGWADLDRCTCYTSSPSVIRKTSEVECDVAEKVAIDITDANRNEDHILMEKLVEVDTEFVKIDDAVSELRKYLKDIAIDILCSVKKESPLNPPLTVTLNNFADKIEEIMTFVQGILNKTETHGNQFPVFQILSPRVKELEDYMQNLKLLFTELLEQLAS